MECKKCGISIDELEIYCENCKEILKKESELNNLILENKELNKLEITKEVETLDNFKDEKKENSSSLKEELKDLVNIDEIETDLLENNKKTMVIVSLLITGLLVSILICFFFLFNRKDEKEIEKEEKIDYEAVLNDYGDHVSLVITKYLETNEEIPSWTIINDLIEYTNYKVVCNVHNIYSNGSIYLNDCKVDDESIKYSYGVEKQEEKSGKKIEIYKTDYETQSYSYVGNNKDGSQLVGFITCKTDSCEFVSAYNKYVLIKENNKYYIYDYEFDSMVFGPFISNENYEKNILSFENNLYGVLYEENNKYNIYNVNTDKTLKDLEGDLLLPMPNLKSNIMYKYGYAIFKVNNENNFINLKTGNISYTINGSINNFVEDDAKKLVYITTFTSANSKIIIYNSNGKKLFEGKEFNNLFIYNGNIIVSSDNNFFMYDTSLNLKIKSKDYDEVLALYNNFIIVIDSKHLAITDFQDNILVTLDFEWDSEKYIFEKQLSGVTKDNEIKLTVLNKETNDYTEYYYNNQTKEINIIEKKD